MDSCLNNKNKKEEDRNSGKCREKEAREVIVRKISEYNLLPNKSEAQVAHNSPFENRECFLTLFLF